MTILQARCLIILSWCLGFAAGTWYAMSVVTVMTPKIGRLVCGPFSRKTMVTDALIIVLMALTSLPGAAFTIVYIKMIIKLRRDGVINPTDVSQSSLNRRRRNLRAARILVMEVLFFLAFLFPFYQNVIATTLQRGKRRSPLTPEGTITICMMVSYSLVNPLCHILLNSEFRKEVKKMFHQCKTRLVVYRGREPSTPHLHLPVLRLRVEETQKNISQITWEIDT